MKKLPIYIGIILIAGITFSVVTLSKSQNVPAAKTNESALKEEDIKWYSITEAVALNKQTRKKIFIDVYATWCGPCKWLEANTFTNPVIQKAITEYYIPVKFNGESADTIYFKDKMYVNQNPGAGPRKSIHEFTSFIATTQQGIAYPTMVFLDEDLNIIQPIAGALAAEQLEPILSYFGTDSYKNQSWETFQQSFKSSLTSQPTK